MIDDSMYSRYNRGADKSLQPLDEPVSGRSEDFLGFMFGVDDSENFDPVNTPPAYQAIRHAMQETRRRTARARPPTNGRTAKQIAVSPN